MSVYPFTKRATRKSYNHLRRAYGYSVNDFLLLRIRCEISNADFQESEEAYIYIGCGEVSENIWKEKRDESSEPDSVASKAF